ncbi:dihydrodipicolinate synthetase family protein [Aspergillus sclerotialis]|uniref:Dihydrodipicolinate synthetase family protein n=1 Tax=Aspergillus sclerotialis TaxID=2070753 RepID=A0A3A2ZRD0_9EURO|nr:dihydrodipicolinate synthetase family protein [Aspergillus sclerotialis]
MQTNGHSETRTMKSYPPGIHAPSITFFKDDDRQDIDWEVQGTHLEYLITSGVHGVVLAGSSGESATLTQDEKGQLIIKTREIATAHGKPNFPITIGCLAGCTRDIIDQTIIGHRSGADYALVLVPGIFHWAMHQKAILDFFNEVGDRSPIPIIIYNFPGITGGLDVNSDMLEILSKHPNICGVKLTCGGVGKITRIAALNSKNEKQFAAVSGQSDWMVGALTGGGSGCISGVANLFPKVLIEIYDLYNAGKVAEATELQTALGTPEWGISTSDVNGMKWIVAKLRGYPDSALHCRRPFPRYDDPEKQARSTRLVAPFLKVEEELSSRK